MADDIKLDEFGEPLVDCEACDGLGSIIDEDTGKLALCPACDGDGCLPRSS